MQWSTEPHGGFTKADKPILPVIADGPYGYQHVNAGRAAARSGLAAQLDRAHHPHAQGMPEIGWGDFRVLPTGPRACCVRYEWRNNAVIALHNLADEPVELSVRVEEDRLINLFSEATASAKGGGAHRIALEPYGYRWFRAGGLDYLLSGGSTDGSVCHRRGRRLLRLGERQHVVRLAGNCAHVAHVRIHGT